MKKTFKKARMLATVAVLICLTSCEQLEGQELKAIKKEDSITKEESVAKRADVWTEIFRDDFATLNTANWTVTNRTDYNSSYCTYANAGVSIGYYDQTDCLVLSATKPGSANAFASGHVKSKASFKPPVNQKYWIRARIKLIALEGAAYKSFKQTYGVWPAFWMTNESNWPVNGETDIVEGYSFGGSETYASNLFYGTSTGVNQLGTSCERSYASGDGWHNYDMFWINDNGSMTIVIQLDGATVATYTNSVNANLQLQNFSAHNILFNLCVGGPMFNNANLNVLSKTMMWVDWVSVASSPIS
ncbi:b-glycosidase, glycoside hydrolase family 16 protein [Pedobacter sp. BAL39]|uniref:glycoside hydrolase family 16 protein n=1 Tax=Pedobacter sp. BAL39 TaxID=391596 RepID=UPI0001559B0A|nr:family 16 glycosylhydrolase [Pedobacter sp. BAL39]EDM36265.1 b-glycosidase, glycoside hydrolase family 16 protein [Pedobacter sp. BAL39]